VNQDKANEVMRIVDNYLTENSAYSGENVAQSDRCIENAVNLACELADLFQNDVYWD